jgi:putative ABC transport system permease protein
MILRQILALTAVGLRSIPHRLGNSLVIVVGIACVVSVLLSLLAMLIGFSQTIQGDAREDRVMVITRGMDSEGNSSLSRENADLIQSAPGIRRDSEGKPVAAAEVVLAAPVIRRDGRDAYITLRGTSPQLRELRPELELVSGRMYRAGLHELIVGRAAHLQFKGLDVGNAVRLHDGDWTIVGIFAGGDSVRDSEAMADATTLMTAYQLKAFNSTTVVLTSRSALAMFQDALRREPTLSVDALPEPEYLAMISGNTNKFLATVAWLIGGIMGIGALFGALNTMYSAVAARLVEIATLRALGFAPAAVVGSIVVEATLLSLTGACVGIGAAYAIFDGTSVNTPGGSRWDSQLVYSLSVSPTLVLLATALACGIGILGGLFPAVRSINASVADSLRTR